MKKAYFTIILGLTLLFSLYSTAIAAPINIQQTTTQVGIVYSTGGLGDGGINDISRNGIINSLAKYPQLSVDEGCTIVCDPAGVSEAISLYASAGGYDLIIGVGFVAATGINEAASAYPDTDFVIIDSFVDLPNVGSINFNEQEGSFLAGAMAGMVTQTKKLGFLGGRDIPLINRFGAGFEHGARYIDESITVDVVYSPDPNNPWGDVNGGSDVANNFFLNGVDVVFAAAGSTGLGVIVAAETRNSVKPDMVYAIGVDADQDGLSPGNVLTSVIKNFNVAVEISIDRIIDGTWWPSFEILGLADGGVEISPMNFTQSEANAEFVPGQTRLQKIDELTNQIINGRIFVFDNFQDIFILPPLIVDSRAYIEHSRILIFSDNDFIAQGFPGLGTEAQPYIIEGYNITNIGGTLITIQNTNAFFEIRNNFLDGIINNLGQDDCIFLADVNNGAVINNTLVNCAQLLLHRSSNIIIDNNLLYGEAGIGIGDFSNNNMIINNEVAGSTSDGIGLHMDSYNNYVQFNDISFGSFAGINIIMASHHNYISNNSIFNNRMNGIEIADNDYNDIVGNMIYDNYGTGIYQNYATQQRISLNEVFNNRGDGIFIGESDTNAIFDNAVYGNHNNGISIMHGSGLNTILHNNVFGNANNGIFTPGSNDNQFNNNTLYDNGDFGIWIGNGAIDNEIIGNDIYRNQIGILVATADYTFIKSNLIHDNYYDGMDIQENAFENKIIRNLIYNQPNSGIYLDPSSNGNQILRNDFNNNFRSVVDDGINNVFTENYYPEWEGTSEYQIEGGAFNKDLSPLAHPEHMSTLLLSIDTGGSSKIVGNVNLTWTEATDIYNHEMIYIIEFQLENNPWNMIYEGPLSLGLIVTFDSTSIDDGQLAFRITARDELGFESEYVSDFYIIDNIPPVTSSTPTSTTPTSTTPTSTTSTSTTPPDTTTDSVDTSSPPDVLPINPTSIFFGIIAIVVLRMKKSKKMKM